MEEFSNFLLNSLNNFENYDIIKQGSIPDELLHYLKLTIHDNSIRSQFGTSEDSWVKISQIFELSRSARSNNRNVPFLRYLNGIVLLGRNLVCTERGGVIAYKCGAGENSLLLLNDLLALETYDPEEEKLIGSLLQLISNMSNEMVTSSVVVLNSSPLQFFLDNSNSNSIASFKLLLSNENFSKPTLQFIESSMKLLDKITYITESEYGQSLFIELLNKTEEWYSNDDIFFSKLLNNIITSVLSSNSGPTFLQSFKEPLVNENQRLSLLKIIDAALESLLLKPNTLNCDSLLTIFYHELTVASAQAIPFIRSADTSPEYSPTLLSQLTNIWNKLIILLDILQSILDNKPSLKSQLLKTDILEQLITLLGESQKSLPQRSKLADINKAASKSTTGDVISDHDELKPEDFPLIKGKIIYLLGTLVENNSSVQNKIRELHGLELVLSNCMIDLNNPYIRERSIICLRYLLEGNPENQSFIAKMEAKETVTEDALHEAGYETELINGKVALKKR